MKNLSTILCKNERTVQNLVSHCKYSFKHEFENEGGNHNGSLMIVAVPRSSSNERVRRRDLTS